MAKDVFRRDVREPFEDSLVRTHKFSLIRCAKASPDEAGRQDDLENLEGRANHAARIKNTGIRNDDPLGFTQSVWTRTPAFSEA